jgi:hypothetical protein
VQAAVWHDNLCAVLPVVSEVYSLLRGQSAAGKWIPPQSFERCVSHPWHAEVVSECGQGWPEVAEWESVQRCTSCESEHYRVPTGSSDRKGPCNEGFIQTKRGVV